MNNAYFQICRGGSELLPDVMEDWYWLRKPRPGILTLEPAITATASVTLGSTGVQLSATEATDLAYYYVRVTGHPDVFRVETHGGSASSLLLDSVYTGPTDDDATCTFFKLEYDLASDVMRVVAPMRVHVPVGGFQDRYKIYRTDLDTMEEADPLTLIEAGVPDKFAEIGPTTAGIRRVRFNRYVAPETTTYTRVEYEYLMQPTALTAPGASEEPKLPLEWRHLLADFLTAYLLGIKDDDKSGGVGSMAQAGLRGLAAENRYQMATANPALFTLRPRGRTRRGLWTESGLRIF